MAFPSLQTASFGLKPPGRDAVPQGLVDLARGLGLDEQTLGHLDRTQRIGIVLARRIVPELAERPDLRWAFYLHDVGKAGVPADVLLKRGPLSEAEWDVMRAHPEIGARLLEPIHELHGVISVVRSHHERWDGSGYPSGAKGEQIPLAARIFAVADSFDAMTSDRPYRRALPTDIALGEIEDGAGSQFDPEVVAAFMGLMADRELSPPRPLVFTRT